MNSSQPTLFVDVEKLKQHCEREYEEYGKCLQKYPQQDRMCAVNYQKLNECAEHYVTEVKKAAVRCTPEIQKFINECSHQQTPPEHCAALKEAMVKCTTRDVTKF